MGWFDEQIKQRKQNDQDVFTDAFINIAGAVMGSRVSTALNDERQQMKNAFDEILRFYHINTKEIPDNITDRNEQLEYLLRPHGIMRRTVTLSKGWYKDAIGAMLGIRKSDGMVVALIPTGFSGYRYRDMETGKHVKINGKNQELFEEEAIAFYKPLPLKTLGISDLMRYILGTLSPADFVMTGASALAVTLIGMLSPKLNNLLFSRVIEDGSTQILLAITVFMICVTLSSLLINGVKSLIIARINTKMSISVQAAVMSRLMSLPAGFFKNYSSGELSARAACSNSLCEMLVSVALTTGLTSVFSLVYISQIFVYAPALVIPSLFIMLATVAFTVISALVQMKVSKKKMELSSKESGMSYALISGVQKIKLSGAEMRAFARWGNLYAEEARLAYNPPMFLKINSVISSGISLAGTLMMYWFAVSSGVSVADYYAFNTAYGMVSGAFISLAGIALTVAQIKPVMDMIEPILKEVPEISEGKQMITRLSGSIELNNVSFRYNENMPLVIDDLSLKIRPGQYVAIVGATGCGKSTLLRLMLGFESPQKGAVYVDGKDIAAVDLKSLRRNIGVVMQNGKLFTGDIFSNIIISAPWLTMDEAWHAAELSGIAEDIRRMPMGMHTMISEGSGGISGGQRQRLMIARAIAPKPKVLMFDEATSALDNLTQKTVSESLDSLKCTRIVIAHRLSTIKQCDRILVLDKGKIIEDGTYEKLIQRGGFFAELVARQRVDDTAELRA
ncbi:NHLP bacteriocin export ABC transporter permease/ATPase subunit [Lachnospiraceae bacterium WCA-9-b2]|uniref:NHLP bacteriocin export ABC transporter permease/ATPase subunit n=1 Tax=Sporofaciens musculi TaxID=2681861 RepID=A0A7X3MJL1_9FIRM|nr:NHLP bacteriocin export ABC transporter permease/ATPase subunit [Sporofaciens musculi]MXP77628.1 NHLP bacteriocin export ABC transporter permease/ATPase subunit [Sporofaciens musculi]